jgi:hypothetical protein
MAGPKCEVRESLEVNARQAVAHEKGLEVTLPEPEARIDAVKGVEFASLNLKDHVATCDVCRQHS